MISQAEMLRLSNFTPEDIIPMYMRDHRMDEAMRFRNELQRALARYSKYNAYDETQRKMIRLCQFVEVVCWRSYFAYRIRNLMRNEPNAVKIGKAGLKIKIKMEWEAYQKRMSY